MATVSTRKGAQTNPVALAPAIAAGTVFAASGAVLVLEILAVRLLAPYVGLTLETTTSIIGAVLAGIAVGAALGGWVSDRQDPHRLAAGLLIGGGLLALLTVPIVRALGPGARGGGDLPALGITLLALVPSAAVLSAVSPTMARIQLHDLHASGTIVGRLSAWATAGALVGTFGTGFVLVPLLSVSTAVLATGLLLVLVGLLLGWHTRALSRGATGAAVATAAALALLAATRDSPCDTETTYHCASVLVDAQNPNGRELMLDDIHHSYVDLANPTNLVYGYTQWIGHAVDAIYPRNRPLDAVFVGGGGFTLPRWLVATRPQGNAHVLEVDGELVDFDKQRLGLRTSPRLTATVGDARMTLRDEPDASADLLVGDAFGSYAVPWHLATREWTEEIKRVLRPDGLYALNVIDMLPLDLLRAETATLLPLFEDVQLVTIPGPDTLPGGGNAVLFASDRKLPDDIGGAAAEGGTAYDRRALVEWAAGAQQLTDDNAPVDQLLNARA
ncbi:fused MFS/spermidine synthase [Conexibacter sp. CPCC 206217]|uniref:fused MFS/spermidine synthase n=1 Tax=Conexibacter sp. CPCC 206217 TaxID=3064574 RepID=UPI002718A112|nr:fused MFS/spermidine synthase [Conexibacter sp. CPCC 206217]MDO8212465.1 fused MFS/spermidine synthase [Conexibacter sp. CPCC 206217]